MKLKWYQAFFYKSMIYMPLVIIWGLMILIYTVYVKYYVLLFLNQVNDGDTKYLMDFYLVSNFPNSTVRIGVFLMIYISWCFFWMIVSMVRTVFMDPGYLKDPLSMEYNLIKMNLEFPESYAAYKERPPGSNSSYANLSSSFGLSSDEEFIHIKKKENSNTKRFKFIKNFGNFINEGPLTSSEFIQYRKNLIKFLSEGEIEKNNINNLTMSAVEVKNVSPDDKFNFNYENIFENFRGLDFSRIVLCTHCLRWKVERAHHCKQCGRCVLKMDHHCPWLANCIGFRNYKFFCLTIFYGFIATLTIFITLWEVVVDVNLKYDTDIFFCCFITFVYVTNFGLLCFLTWLINSNWTLLFSNQTTIEKSDKERFTTSGIKAYNYYDQGILKNFISVFGKNPILWLFPFSANYKGEGMLFESYSC